MADYYTPSKHALLLTYMPIINRKQVPIQTFKRAVPEWDGLILCDKHSSLTVAPLPLLL